jgi:hypothetical protein
MSENLVDIAVTQFSANLELKIQQQVSRLRGRVAEGTHKGKQASPVQYIAPVKMQTPAGRFAPKNRVDASFERRWVFPQDGEIDQFIDTFDELRVISDPKSQYSTNAAASVARYWDDVLIAAATADAKLGTDINSFTTETFSGIYSGALIIADTFGTAGGSTSVGLTPKKLREAKRLFKHYGQDGNPDNELLTYVGGSTQESDLLAQIEVVNKDYNGDGAQLRDGVVTRFMGFDMVFMERLPTVASNVRGTLAFMKSGLYLGVWQDMVSRASQRNDLSSEPWDLHTQLTCGATRLQAGKLLQIKCADSAGASIVP